MKTRTPPKPVPTEQLAAYFQSKGIAYEALGSLNLGFGEGKDQYRLYPYPAPLDDETMGLFCEWHTKDYFEVDTGPHVAIGMRGPVVTDPHRGRGLAIGILANRTSDPNDPERTVELFKGCPEPPGGPSFFIEDFTVCDGKTPICEWQLSLGKPLPGLKGYGVYRIDIHVSRDGVWAGVWQVNDNPGRAYTFLGETFCPDTSAGFGKPVNNGGCEHVLDRGRGNAFIGTGFSDPNTRSHMNNIYIAHWKNTL